MKITALTGSVLGEIQQYIERGWLAADWAVAPDNIGDFGEIEMR